jgi:hypothetical protein
VNCHSYREICFVISVQKCANKWAVEVLMAGDTYLLFAALHQRYVCTDRANVSTRNLSELQIHCQPRSTEADRWLSLGATALPAFSSLPSIRACAFRPELRSWNTDEGEGGKIMFVFSASRPQNPLRSFYGPVLRLFTDWKIKGFVIYHVNLCDVAIISWKYLLWLAYVEQRYRALWLG